MKQIVTAVIVAAVLAAGWYFVSPLFIDVAVDEEADFLTADGQLDMDRVLSMSAKERDGMKQRIMDVAARTPAKIADDSMPAEAPQVVKTGEFIDADAVHRGEGQAAVYSLPNGNHVVRLENFRTTNGPALVVYLATHPSPGSADDVTNGGYLSLGKLKGNVGNQNYDVPAGADVSQYNSVVIWCELFGVLFSPAALSGT